MEAFLKFQISFQLALIIHFQIWCNFANEEYQFSNLFWTSFWLYLFDPRLNIEVTKCDVSDTS